jgi:hypothetical protein
MRMSLNVSTVLAAWLGMSIALTGMASAQTFLGPIHYVSQADSPFNTADPTFVLEDFEDDLLNIPGVSSNLLEVIGPGGLTDSVDADDGAIDGNGTNGHSGFANGQIGITFTFDPVVLGGLPTSAGIVWTDGGGTTSFEAFGAGGVSLGTIGPSAIADGSFSGGTGEDHFFGVIHAAGIASIKITNTAGGIEVDHLQFSFGSGSACPGDTNNSGAVDVDDLVAVILGWGACGDCAPPNCPADVNGSCAVDVDDLIAVILGWGVCR